MRTFALKGKVKVIKTYSYKMKKGDIVKVDRVMVEADSASFVRFRVTGVYKTPQWFDSDWFVNWV